MAAEVSRATTVRGPDGEVLSRADLPEPGTRWTARRKAIVAAAIYGGIISMEEATAMYMLSVDEYHAWERASQKGGYMQLRVNKIRENR